MSAFSGPQAKGAAKRHRETKRLAAVSRSLATPHERMRAHRLGRCSCTPESALLRRVFGGAA